MDEKNGTQLIPGKRLAKIRKQKGFTQTDLAELLNVSRQTITDYESGRIRLNDEIIIKLVKHFNISADELLGLKETESSGEDESLRIMKRLRRIQNLSTSKQKTILSSLDMMLDSANKQTSSNSGTNP